MDNSEGKDYNQETLRAYRDAKKFTNGPHSAKAKRWIRGGETGNQEGEELDRFSDKFSDEFVIQRRLD